MSHVEVRAASVADAPQIADLAERTFRDSFADENAAADMDAYVNKAFALDRVRFELSVQENVFLVAEAPDRLLGYAKLRTGPAEPCVTGLAPLELHRIYVDSGAIGRGVGAALMRAVLAHAEETGHETLWLGVWERNARAIAFYERWEFVEVGSHVFQLGADAQTDLIMERPVRL